MKFLISLLTLFTFISCSDHNDSTPETPDMSRDLLFLKVDFQTNAFMGGTESHFENVLMTPNIPFEETYIPPADFGNYSLKFIPTGSVVFDGPVSWLGGEHNYPVQQPSTDFVAISTAASVDLTAAQYFTPTADIIAGEGYATLNYQAVWNAVKNLQITNNYVSNNAKVGFLLYTPGLGVFQPENACWFVILYK